MALDINEARKGSGEPDAFLGLAKELTDFGERQSFLRMKDMPFDKALREFVTSCERWCYTPYEDMQKNFEGTAAAGSLEIMSHVIYTGVLSALLDNFEYLSGYVITDNTVYDEEGMPILLYKEIYINYCLYEYIHSEGTEAKEYYKMRAEQGFGCTLDEEVTRRAMEDPMWRMDYISPEAPTAEEILYEGTKMWGVDPENQYSFVRGWETSTNMPQDFIKVATTFMSALRDYIDIADICSMSAETFMHAAYVLATKYKIFNETCIESIHKLSMLALRFRCYLDQQRKQEAWHQQKSDEKRNLIC